jgi:hypothetical protein
MPLTNRLATAADEPALSTLMSLAIEQLQSAYLTAAQVQASHGFMGLDRRLIGDRTYFVVEAEGAIAGCGGWSRRATAYGGDHTAGRDDRMLDPATEAAKVRAMYTPTMSAKASARPSWRCARPPRGRRALPRWNCRRRWPACRSIAASGSSTSARSRIAACR